MTTRIGYVDFINSPTPKEQWPFFYRNYGLGALTALGCLIGGAVLGSKYKVGVLGALAGGALGVGITGMWRDLPFGKRYIYADGQWKAVPALEEMQRQQKAALPSAGGKREVLGSFTQGQSVYDKMTSKHGRVSYVASEHYVYVDWDDGTSTETDTSQLY